MEYNKNNFKNAREINKYLKENASKILKYKFPHLDFSEFEYTGSEDKSTYICDIHGKQKATFLNMYNSDGCSRCAVDYGNKNRKSIKDNTMRILKEKFPHFDFSKFIYTKAMVKSTVICTKHNISFQAKPNYLRNKKYVCPECIKENVSNLKKTKDDFLSSIKDKFPDYDFSKFVYTNRDTSSTIICKIHNIEFEAKPVNLTNNQYKVCPKCINIISSRPEKEIIEYIKTFYNYKIEENTKDIIRSEYTNRKLELDIYLPDINLAIEFNGSYWHSDKIMSKRNRFFNTAEEHHNYKTKLCNDKNIKLIHINQSNYIKNKSKELNKVKTVVTKLCELLETPKR